MEYLQQIERMSNIKEEKGKYEKFNFASNFAKNKIINLADKTQKGNENIEDIFNFKVSLLEIREQNALNSMRFINKAATVGMKLGIHPKSQLKSPKVAKGSLSINTSINQSQISYLNWGTTISKAHVGSH